MQISIEDVMKQFKCYRRLRFLLLVCTASNEGCRSKINGRVSASGRERTRILALHAKNIISYCIDTDTTWQVQCLSSPSTISIQTREIVSHAFGGHRTACEKRVLFRTGKESLLTGLGDDEYLKNGQEDPYRWSLNLGAQIAEEIRPETSIAIIVADSQNMFHLANAVFNELYVVNKINGPRYMFGPKIDGSQIVIFDRYKGLTASIT